MINATALIPMVDPLQTRVSSRKRNSTVDMYCGRELTATSPSESECWLEGGQSCEECGREAVDGLVSRGRLKKTTSWTSVMKD